MKNNNLKLLSIIILAMVVLTGCSKAKTENKDAKEENPISVGARTLKEARSSSEMLEYPAIVAADQEAKIIAKASGNAEGVNFNIGDKVKMGQTLLKIDDVGSKSSPSTLNAGQIKQASIAVGQADANYRLAQSNYQNMLIQAEKDLAQARIAKNQAATGIGNLDSTTKESLKSAELAYESAKLAAEQAKIALDDRKKLNNQSGIDTETNADLTADTIANTCNSVIESINNATAFDTSKGINVSYKLNLGVLESNSYLKAENSYKVAKAKYDEYKSKTYADTPAKVDAVLALAQSVKKLADDTKNLFDKSVSSNLLPQDSSFGPSLSGLQSAAAGWQSQVNGAISQANAAKQSLKNVGLNSDATLNSLTKAYELAKKQESSALQNLNSLKAGNKTQKDQAGYGLETAAGQYDSLKAKYDSQIAVSKSQVELAQLQYSNAVIALQNLYDIHTAITPIDGTITKKSVSEGDAVSPGQLIAVVSKTEKIKLQFYVDQDNLEYLSVGQRVDIEIEDSRTEPGRITAVTPQADEATKRFLIEVKPDKEDPKAYASGSIMDVRVNVVKSPSNPGNIILPVSAIEIGQNASHIFTIKDGKASKEEIKIEKVAGESAEISTNLPEDTVIVVNGNKLLHEGDAVAVE